MKQAKKKNYQKYKLKKQSPLLILLIPIVIITAYIILQNKEQVQEKPPKKQEPKVQLVPTQYLPIYKAAEKKYGVPWYVLAAHHRVETRFSTMDPMISPVGAEGPMQFMPCTFVGWSHPTCTGKGVGNIPEKEKEDPVVIHKYGGYGVDANGDGKADIWDLEDAVFSAANYLSQNGAAEGNLKQAIYSYNHSEDYVNEVLHYARLYKKDE
ncbi:MULTISPECIES: lytic transglycosylase domain-containing protein [Heyndrickxia]|jgi:soluble lytic murein transglycosylase-like protein|uniref:Transglycosylase SLT domain-containing protein n=1 Tax=Heyndrickxia oleronia TaxID=38875 RepID=A0A8E2LCH4_9BACI|nr:lytic transglycosylase domain-containing protein [Heyndrickxia oleronia]NYV64955.1 lytic transglycosylase domain-containing protein [Bacillus sp. Gen3]MBU5210362.1 lytic transglycosylase domain-containing protein [Heyndrickxia oleronia]MCI1590734.1 lytic transglycosylase domain-containing protein [Heyndrickxia oleronia]MCI1612077.1 lytic transglycosylase domain-containing protein [Heyndrickxia oleronia]MCI1759786.1 lytic transglycosylase domain-containing protein [Heyndrickxia oleronia]